MKNLSTYFDNATTEELEEIRKKVSSFDFYELKERYSLIAEIGKEDHKHYFFKYNDEVYIEYHDRGETTVSTLSIVELIDYYTDEEK